MLPHEVLGYWTGRWWLDTAYPKKVSQNATTEAIFWVKSHKSLFSKKEAKNKRIIDGFGGGRTVYRWVKDGRLRAYHLGGGKSARVRIAGDDLAKMLRESG